MVKDNQLNSLKDLFHATGLRARQMATPVFLALLTSIFEGVHLALLVPLVEGVLSLGFDEVMKSGLLKRLVHVFPGILETSKAIFVFLILAVFLSAVIKNGFAYFARLANANIMRRFVFNLRRLIFSQFLLAGKQYYDKKSVGSLQQILIGYSQIIGNTLYHYQDLTANILMFSVYVGIMIWISWPLTLLAVTVFPLLNYFMRWLIKKIRATSSNYAKHSQLLGKKAFDIFSCQLLVKANSMEVEENKLFSDTCNHVRMIEYSLDKKNACVVPFQETVMLIGILMLITFMAEIVATGQEAAAIARFLIFFYVMRRAMHSFRVISEARGVFAEVTGCITEIAKEINESSQSRVPDGSEKLDDFKHEIEFRELSFSYVPNVPVLKKINLTFKKGDMTAIVGPTGSGKSTIANLIMRYYDCPPEAIFIDGKDIRTLKAASLHQRVSMVSQDIQLFNASLKENIIYGFRKKITEEQLMHAVSKARLKNYIDRLPEGLGTVIGDRGVQLSGGEKQRVSIARAFLKASEILILDEATSSLDTETEQVIQQAMDELMKEKTAIVIAHRLSTIRNANKIIFIENGIVAEKGSFNELLTLKGRFFQFWNQQKTD